MKSMAKLMPASCEEEPEHVTRYVSYKGMPPPPSRWLLVPLILMIGLGSHASNHVPAVTRGYKWLQRFRVRHDYFFRVPRYYIEVQSSSAVSERFEASARVAIESPVDFRGT